MLLRWRWEGVGGRTFGVEVDGSGGTPRARYGVSRHAATLWLRPEVMGEDARLEVAVKLMVSISVPNLSTRLRRILHERFAQRSVSQAVSQPASQPSQPPDRAPGESQPCHARAPLPHAKRHASQHIAFARRRRRDENYS